MRPSSTARRFVAAMLIAPVLAGCGGGHRRRANAKAVAAKPSVGALPADRVPTMLLDLEVKPEESTSARSAKRPFIDTLGLYSLRKDDLLEATLQISRFSSRARYRDASFRQSVIAQIGSTTPQPFRMGERTIYLTTGRRQNVSVWFDGPYLFILSAREDYNQPRALLRAALGIKP